MLSQNKTYTVPFPKIKKRMELDKIKIKKEILKMVQDRKKDLKAKIKKRNSELDSETPDSHQLFKILGFPQKEAKKIDKYHNIGRLLYRNSGTLMEEIVKHLLEITKNAETLQIPSHMSSPTKFNIDASIDSEKRAYEIKWKHSTTDGDHVNKEVQKPKSLKQEGWTPVHLVFFTSDRQNAKDTLEKIKNSYLAEDGEVYIGKDAWKHLAEYTGFDLHEILFGND